MTSVIELSHNMPKLELPKTTTREADMEWFRKWRAARVRRNSPCPAMGALPVELEAYWRHGAPQEYPGIRTDAFFFALAADGLMRFFDVVRHAGGPCALPSEASDSVWHAWLRWNPIGLDQFQRQHFGAAIPHVERAGLGEGALANTLIACRTLAGLAPHEPFLPFLFGLDAKLRMPLGHGYWIQDNEVMYARLDHAGARTGQAQPHPELALSALVTAGLVDAVLLEAFLRQQRAALADQGSGITFTDDSPGFAFASDGDCGDGGGGDGDGGSSCGSSCGGGCGGGGD
jgi:hypothetical protein